MNKEEKSTITEGYSITEPFAEIGIEPAKDCDGNMHSSVKDVTVLKPHEDYDFVNHDKVFVENQDGTKDYFELYYEQEVSCWIMVTYTDSTYANVKIEKDGLVMAKPMHDYGYDVVKRFVDYE